MARRRRQKLKTEPRPLSPSTAFQAEAAGAITRKEKLSWAGILLVAYGYIATWGQFDFSDLMGYYNLQADGFLQGHLYIARTPEQGYLQDMVPYHGRYYLQWGPFPAILHLLPKLVGANLSDRVACVLAGWLTSLVFLEIMLLLWRRYFPALPKWVCRWFFFAFAWGTPTAIVSLRGTIYHESIAWAALCVLAGFLALLRYAEKLSPRWALLAGFAMGLAAATRVTQVLYGGGLFAGFAALLYRRKRPLKPSLAHLAVFSAPVAASVLLMLAYNQVRFNSPWEYGLTHLPTVDAQKPPYALGRAAENFRHYVLAPIKVSRDAPWLEHVGWQPLVNTGRAEDMSSMFLASPFLLLGALSWRVFRSGAPEVRIFAAVAACSAMAVFFTLLCFSGTSRRYMQDFVPMLMILAFVGVALHARNGVEWLRWQPAAWVVFLFSALVHVHLVFYQPASWAPLDPNVHKTFVALSPIVRRILPGHKLDGQEALHRNELGILCMNQGRYGDAVPQFERALQLLPHSQEIALNLKTAKEMQGQQRPAPRR